MVPPKKISQSHRLKNLTIVPVFLSLSLVWCFLGIGNNLGHGYGFQRTSHTTCKLMGCSCAIPGWESKWPLRCLNFNDVYSLKINVFALKICPFLLRPTTCYPASMAWTNFDQSRKVNFLNLLSATCFQTPFNGPERFAFVWHQLVPFWGAVCQRWGPGSAWQLPWKDVKIGRDDTDPTSPLFHSGVTMAAVAACKSLQRKSKEHCLYGSNCLLKTSQELQMMSLVTIYCYAIR